jgi:hypothetical protein
VGAPCRFTLNLSKGLPGPRVRRTLRVRSPQRQQRGFFTMKVMKSLKVRTKTPTLHVLHALHGEHSVRSRIPHRRKQRQQSPANQISSSSVISVASCSNPLFRRHVRRGAESAPYRVQVHRKDPGVCPQAHAHCRPLFLRDGRNVGGMLRCGDRPQTPDTAPQIEVAAFRNLVSRFLSTKRQRSLNRSSQRQQRRMNRPRRQSRKEAQGTQRARTERD